MHRLPKTSFVLLSLAVVSIFLLPSDALAIFGYTMSGASAHELFKVHPSFYFVFMSIVSLFIYKGGKSLFLSCFCNKKSLWLLLTLVLVFVYQVLILRAPMAQVVVTWFTPVLLWIMVSKLSQEHLYILYRLTILSLLISFFMALLEYITGTLIIPVSRFSADDFEFIDFTSRLFSRSKGAFDHALGGGVIACIVAVGLYAKTNVKPLSLIEKLLLVVALLSLPAFGARASLAVTIVFFTLIGLRKLYCFVKVSPPITVLLVFKFLLLLLTPVALYGFVLLGLFDNLLARMNDDNGSAFTRIAVINMLYDMPVWNVIFGDFNHQIPAKLIQYGTPFGIEISWLAIGLQQGFLLLLGVSFVIWQLIQKSVNRNGLYIYWPAVAFILALSSGTGLASKTLLMSQFFLITYILFNGDLSKRMSIKRVVF